IVETLLARGYVVREKKALRITDLGRYLVAIVGDPQLKSPELTGGWEHELKEIEAGRRSREEFMAAVVAYTHALVRDGQRVPVDGLGRCPRCGSGIVEGREGFGCSAWRDGCGFV